MEIDLDVIWNDRFCDFYYFFLKEACIISSFVWAVERLQEFESKFTWNFPPENIKL